MGNCIGLMSFLELCCQFKVGNRIILAYWSQVGTWTFRVHPWRSRRLHHCWWDRDLWKNNVWTWGGHVEILLKTWRTLPIVIFYDIGMLWGNRFGHIRTHGCCCGGSTLWCKLSATLEYMSESFSIATIWESPMLKNGAWGSGFFRAWDNLCAVMMKFLRNICRGVDYCVGKNQRILIPALLLFWWHILNGTYCGM